MNHLLLFTSKCYYLSGNIYIIYIRALYLPLQPKEFILVLSNFFSHGGIVPIGFNLVMIPKDSCILLIKCVCDEDVQLKL
jgi:hypothetical protein